MTCVVAIGDGNKVVMGADSQGTGGWDSHDFAVDKVFAKGAMLFGYTTSYRMGQLLRYKLTLPDRHGETDDEYLCGPFIDAVRQCFKDGGFSKVDLGVETGGEFLVGYRGLVYKVESNFMVARRRDGFDSCGCGEDYAMGALHVAKGSVRTRITTALEAAVRFSAGVGGPLVFVEGAQP